MNKRLVRSGIAVLALLGAASAPLAAQTGQAGRVDLETYRLPNGLRVILAPDPAVGAVAVNVWYDVGSRDEPKGRTGFAHLFEHMMFQGSANVPRGDHFVLVERAGGDMQNGTTEWNRTNYYQTLPSNRLNLGLWLEADRMRSLAVTQENLDNQRAVVQEEKRQRIDNQAYVGAMYETIMGVFNQETCFPYAHSIIGSFDDLNAASLDDVKSFFRTYYAPNNATLTLAGGFDPAQAKQMITQYFGDIPSAPEAPRTTCTQPFTHLPQARTIQDTRAPLPAVMIAYGIPAPTEPDYAAVSLLNSILSSGENARLDDRLVDQEKAAIGITPLFLTNRGPSAAMYWLNAAQGVEPARLQTLFDEEIARIRRDGVTQEELVKARNGMRAQQIFERQVPHGTAEALQYATHYYGDPAYINRSLEPFMAVTRDDIRRVAERYLSPQNRIVVTVVPAAAAQE
ncbi:M16 family metallopeptidase [Longimicrobium terrae]|uniref:Putative Zn-dependent peptidase n=1 Tax=Longimicrobium terrae TaxID=1639882 RepID=A0A841H1X3_9BACT|nr:pitrilysin family protein [Longimicrobium terrae]MBB4637684.1 putative Zn-dependent peptidase [Longimicrobium terrae]MBB6072081.1 putative Zn-dependent peptidase [Longimicrobium terrae]NNC29835.1 insulinase family protein [Longimicrobium terrae]